MIKGICFDLDGTLLDTAKDIWNIYQTIFRGRGWPDLTEEKIRENIGNGLQVLATSVLPPGIPFTEDYLDEVRRTYLAIQGKYIRIFEGISEMLTELKARGYKVAIVSNKMDEAAREVSKRYFPGLIDFTVGSTAGKLKPAPYTTWEALEALKLSREEAVYCGDMIYDVQTARNAGIPCIGAGWGYRGVEKLKEYGADKIAAVPMDVVKILEEMNS